MIHEILRKMWYYSPDVVFCRMGHTRKILECTRNQICLSILIIPFQSRDKHELIIFANPKLMFSQSSTAKEVSFHMQSIFPLFNKTFLFIYFLNNYALFCCCFFSNQCSL